MPFMTYINRHTTTTTTTTTTTKPASKDLYKRTQNTRKRREIGDYYLGKTIGRGASGRVKVGYHLHTGERVAIKVISRNLLATSSSMAKCVQRELAVLQLLHHPHLVDLRQVLQDSSNVYFVMEYMEGGELFQVLSERGRLPEEEARSLFRQLTEALSWCHAHHICHRDLKPENILLDKDHKTLKLADFGMATVYRPDSMLQTSCGSPHYASPEIVRGKHYHGPATDVWSCGVILYAMLAGHLPFDDDNISRLLVKIKSGRYIPLPSYVSPEAKDLVKSMLVVDPAKRINLESVLVHPWLTNRSFLGTDLRFPDTLSLYDKPRDLVADLNLEQPLISNASDIDGRIWETLKILWRNCTQNELIAALTSNESNIPKITCRLLQQRAWRQEQEQANNNNILTKKTSQSFSPSSEESGSSVAPMTPPLTPYPTNNTGTCCKHHRGYSKSSISNLPPTPCDSTIDTISCTTTMYESPTHLKSIPAFDFDYSWHSDMTRELNDLLKKRPYLIGDHTNIDPCPGTQTKSHRSGSIGSSDSSSNGSTRSSPNSPLLLLNLHQHNNSNNNNWSPICKSSSAISFTADGLSSPVAPVVSGTTPVQGALIRTTPPPSPLPHVQLLHQQQGTSALQSCFAAEQRHAADRQPCSFSLIFRCLGAARSWYKAVTETKTASRIRTFHRKAKHECEVAGKFHQVLEQHFNGKLSGRIYPTGQIVWSVSMVLSHDASLSSSSSPSFYKRHQLHFICHITPSHHPTAASNGQVQVTLVLKQGDSAYIDEAVKQILHVWDTLEADAMEISKANGWLPLGK